MHTDKSLHVKKKLTTDKCSRVSPFGHRRVIGLWLLTGDYRCHMRPSSVDKTKASTVCVSRILRPFPSDVKEQSGPDRARTGDLYIANVALWPAELQALH